MTAPVALVTGGAVGIGRAIAIAVGERGGLLFNIDPDEEQNLETGRLVERAGGRCVSFAENAGDAQAVKRIFTEIAGQVDRLDLLANNAAIWNDTSLTGGDYDSQTQAFERALQSCTTAAFCCTMAALPLLEQSANANIINLNTEHMDEDRALTHIAAASGYDCAKFSLSRLTKSWARELAPKNIRVNELCFGAVDTPMLRAVNQQIAEAGMKAEDIAAAVFHIVDQGPEGITGAACSFGYSGSSRQESLSQIAALAHLAASKD